MDQRQFEDGNAQSPDEAQDLAPRFHRGKGEQDDDDDAEDDGDVDSEQNNDGGMKSTWGEGWTARKWAARLLDHLSFVYRDAILPPILPQIENRLLSHQNWEVRESAVLVLGAISRGCLEGLEQFLPKILEMLLGMCDDKKVMVFELINGCSIGTSVVHNLGRRDAAFIVVGVQNPPRCFKRTQKCLFPISANFAKY